MNLLGNLEKIEGGEKLREVRLRAAKDQKTRVPAISEIQVPEIRTKVGKQNEHVNGFVGDKSR